jgi:hypothetical protein
MVDYVSRAEWGARAPEGRRLLVVNNVLNVAFHWPGSAKPINAVGAAGFARVCSALRGWQKFHMDGRGWSDIAYQAAIDQVGRPYTLRGLPIMSGANGDGTVNAKYGAVLLVLGPGEQPSTAMCRTAKAVMVDYRDRFPKVPKRPTWHGAVREGGTICPGPAAIAAIKAGKFDAGVVVTPTPTPTPTPPPLSDWEKFMALFNTKEEFEEAVASGVETGVGRYVSRFLRDEAGSGDTILDDNRAYQESVKAALNTIAANTAKP